MRGHLRGHDRDPVGSRERLSARLLERLHIELRLPLQDVVAGEHEQPIVAETGGHATGERMAERLLDAERRAARAAPRRTPHTSDP